MMGLIVGGLTWCIVDATDVESFASLVESWGSQLQIADRREDVPFPVMVIGVKVEEALAFKTGVPTA